MWRRQQTDVRLPGPFDGGELGPQGLGLAGPAGLAMERGEAFAGRPVPRGLRHFLRQRPDLGIAIAPTGGQPGAERQHAILRGVERPPGASWPPRPLPDDPTPGPTRGSSARPQGPRDVGGDSGRAERSASSSSPVRIDRWARASQTRSSSGACARRVPAPGGPLRSGTGRCRSCRAARGSPAVRSSDRSRPGGNGGPRRTALPSEAAGRTPTALGHMRPGARARAFSSNSSHSANRPPSMAIRELRTALHPAQTESGATRSKQSRAACAAPRLLADAEMIAAPRRSRADGPARRPDAGGRRRTAPHQSRGGPRRAACDTDAPPPHARSPRTRGPHPPPQCPL